MFRETSHVAPGGYGSYALGKFGQLGKATASTQGGCCGLADSDDLDRTPGSPTDAGPTENPRLEHASGARRHESQFTQLSEHRRSEGQSLASAAGNDGHQEQAARD